MVSEAWLHGGVATLALALCTLIALRPQLPQEWDAPEPEVLPTSTVTVVTDARGRPIPVAASKRIVVTAGMPLVHELVTIERIAAVDAASTSDPAIGWALDATARIIGVEDFIGIRRHAPDLVLVLRPSDPAGEAAIVRLEQAGSTVFAIDAVHTWDDLRRRIATLGQLLGVEARSARLLSDLEIRRRLLAGVTPPLAGVTVILPTVCTSDRRARCEAAVTLAGLHPVARGETSAVTLAFGPLSASAASDIVALPSTLLADPLGGDLIEAASRMRDIAWSHQSFMKRSP